MVARNQLRHVDIDSAALIPEMTERIVRAFDPVKIILFGSRARGDAGSDSDVDLLVILDDPLQSKREATIAILRVLRGLIVSVDVVVTTPREIERRGDVVGSILRPALRDGNVIYAR